MSRLAASLRLRHGLDVGAVAGSRRANSVVRRRPRPERHGPVHQEHALPNHSRRDAPRRHAVRIPPEPSCPCVSSTLPARRRPCMHSLPRKICLCPAVRRPRLWLADPSSWDSPFSVPSRTLILPVSKARCGTIVGRHPSTGRSRWVADLALHVLFEPCSDSGASRKHSMPVLSMPRTTTTAMSTTPSTSTPSRRRLAADPMAPSTWLRTSSARNTYVDSSRRQRPLSSS